MSVETETAKLATADGVSLEAEMRVPADPWARVVLAHPHPQQGGSMRSLVTSELFASLPGHGVAALRFNFRGVGDSEGDHDEGRGEAADVVAGIDAMSKRCDAGPLVLAGWSFGADVSLSVTDSRLTGWVPVAPPLRVIPIEDMVAAVDQRPKVIVVPENDPFNPPKRCRAETADWVATTVEVITGGDHFLVGRTDRLVELLVDTCRSWVDMQISRDGK